MERVNIKYLDYYIPYFIKDKEIDVKENNYKLEN